jgi:hypothetical protein
MLLTGRLLEFSGRNQRLELRAIIDRHALRERALGCCKHAHGQ